MKYEIMIDSKEKTTKIMCDGVEISPSEISFSMYSYMDKSDKIKTRVSIGQSMKKDDNTYLSTYMYFDKGGEVEAVLASKETSSPSLDISKKVSSTVSQEALNIVVAKALSKK